VAHIEKRLRGSKVTYRARYRDPAGRERSKTFTRRVDAERFVVEVEHAKSRGAWVDPTLGRITFAAWLDQWWATTTNLRESTQARDQASLRVHAIPRFGRIPLAAIRQIEVRAWVADLAGQSLKPATVVKAYQLFGKVMAAAVDAGIIAQSPCRRIPLPKVEQDEKRFLTPAEIAQLASIIAPRFRVLVLVSAYGGLRIGELAGLRRSRVDITRATVTVLEIATDVSGRLVVGPPKTRAARPSASRPLWPTNSSITWPPTRSPTLTPSSSPRRRGAPFAPPTSAGASGGRPSVPPSSTACASTIFGTRRSPYGSRPAHRPRRSPAGPGIRR
jgi:hypothetical protein